MSILVPVILFDLNTDYLWGFDCIKDIGAPRRRQLFV